MIPERVRGNKKSRSEISETTKEIRKMMANHLSDVEILSNLKIPRSTFYRYKSRIYNQDSELWQKVSIEPLESRALKIIESLEDTYRISRKFALDENNNARVRINASKGMVNAQYNILKLLKMGPDAEYFEIV